VRKNRYKKRSNGPPRLAGVLRLMLGGVKLSGLLTLLLLVSAIFVSGYATATHSAYFRTESIQVSGNQRIGRDEILSQAGIKEGENLLAINLHVARERLMAHSWISSARISRDIPESITIQVKEHAPIAVLDMGRKFLLNAQGRIFKEFDESDPSHLPLVTGISYMDISLGDDPLSTSMQAALELLEICRSNNGALPYDEIAELHMDKEIGATLVTQNDQRRIKFGFGEFTTKNQRLKQILPVLENNSQWCEFQILDAINPDRVVVQLGSIPQATAKGM
jgi:cell division protein FtsQ